MPINGSELGLFWQYLGKFYKNNLGKYYLVLIATCTSLLMLLLQQNFTRNISTASDGKRSILLEPNFKAMAELFENGCDPNKVQNLVVPGSSSEFISNSQHGQDRWIYDNVFSRLLQSNKTGYFIEFGARDGITHSNTYAFEKMGWSGILVEPNDIEFKQIAKNRPRSKALHGALCDRREIRNFWVVSWPGWSGLETNLRKSGASDVIENKVASGEWKKTVVPIKCLYLQDHLDKMHINLLSADCEGCENEVLESINWDLVLIDVIAIERQCSKPIVEFEFIWFIQKKGFKLVNWASSDLIFVRQELATSLNL